MAVKWKWKPAAGGAVSPDLANRVQNLETNTVKITGDQSIGGVKTFTSTGEVIKINPNSDTSAYLSGYKSGNQRAWYFGKSSSTDNNLRIGADRGDIKLEPNGKVDLSNKKISFLADPAANQDAANKQYVDNRIQKRIITQTINVSSAYTISPTSGYEIISVMVGRKRTSDSFYFFTHNVNLNFQVYLQNNDYKIYNNGTVNDFNNEYKIVVVEKKV